MMHPRRLVRPSAATILTSFCGVVILLGACIEGKPDAHALARLVATIVIDETAIDPNRHLVIDTGSLADIEPEIRAAMIERLDSLDPGWLREDVVGHFDEMPGQWEMVEGLGRVNQTHLFITFSVGGTGRERRLVYMRSYCALCGKGERIQLTWDGREWIRTTESKILL